MTEKNLPLEQIGFSTLSDLRARTASLSSPMKRGEMIVTSRCTFHCPYCQGLPPTIRPAMTWDEISAGLTFWVRDRLENLRFSGGEPALHPHLLDAVRLAKDSGVERIAITTNGSASTAFYQRLIDMGLSDFSISLDACTAETGDRMAGNLPGAWQKVVDNIREISKRAVVIVNIVFNQTNVNAVLETIRFVHELGVKDILLISSSQYNQSASGLNMLPAEILAAHPILKYRAENTLFRPRIRGLSDSDSRHCAIVLDDSIIAGDLHFPCSLYMREKGMPIGRVGPTMRQERFEWYSSHDTHTDPICKTFCVDLYIDYNNKFAQFHTGE